MRLPRRRQALIDFEPFDKQAGPLLSQAPIITVVTGIRGGKTSLGAFWTAMASFQQPNFWEEDIRKKEPYTILVCAPDFPQLDRAAAPALMRLIPQEIQIGQYNSQKRLLRVQGKHGVTNIWFLTGKTYKSWEGVKAYRVWCDEFTRIREEAFDILSGRCIDRNGRILLTGTPQGPNWAFSRLKQPFDAAKKTGKDHPLVDFYTWRTIDNPYIQRERIAEVVKTMPKRYYERTFLADWSAFEGQIYEDLQLYAPDGSPVHAQPRSRYCFYLPHGRTVGDPKDRSLNHVRLTSTFAGMDWGFRHKGVLQVCGRTPQGTRWALETVSEEMLKVPEQRGGGDSWVRRARQMKEKWGLSAIYCDPARPEYIEEFADAGLPAEEAANAVEPGIQTVATFMALDNNEQKVYGFQIIEDLCKPLCDELPYYHFDDNGKPHKENDDSCDALRYAIYTDTIRGSFDRQVGWSPQPAGSFN